MGTPKALLPLGGEPLIVRLTRVLLEGGASRVLVVVAGDATGDAISTALSAFPTAAVQIVINSEPARGMLSSVQAGIQALSPLPAAVLICPCDLPQLEPMHVVAVIHTYHQTGNKIIAPVFAGKRGHPALFDAMFLPEILAMDPEIYGLNELLKRHADCIIEREVSSDGVLHDADTPDEWKRLTE